MHTKTLNVTETATTNILNCLYCDVSVSLKPNMLYSDDVFSSGTTNEINRIQLTNKTGTEQYSLIRINPIMACLLMRSTHIILI